MRYATPTLKRLALGMLALFLLLMAAEVMARRGGGRGGSRGGGRSFHGGHVGHTRMGPASGGSFASRPVTRAQTTSRPSTLAPKVDWPRPRPDVPPAVRHERREEVREEIRDDHWDYYHHRRHRIVVGTVYEASDFSSDYCEATVVVDNVNYYQCEGTWYKRAYSGGSVTYVVVDGPGRD